jgi:hypothetical protein
MAKLIQQHQVIYGSSPSPARAPHPEAGDDSRLAAGIYDMPAEISGNVNFVLVLSGNSTFRVDVVPAQ